MSTWTESSNGGHYSKLALISGPDRISIGDNCTISERCVLRGDVTMFSTSQPSIVLEKFCFLSKGCQILPPVAKASEGSKLHSDVCIGSYTVIGENTQVRLAVVGKRVFVGANCILGELSTINDCCVIEDNTVIPPKIVIPQYSLVSGTPGRDFEIRELSPAYKKVIETDARIRHVFNWSS